MIAQYIPGKGNIISQKGNPYIQAFDNVREKKENCAGFWRQIVWYKTAIMQELCNRVNNQILIYIESRPPEKT